MSTEAQASSESVHFSPWALWKSGILPSHTILGIETYNLACVPYQFSMQRAILIGSFSHDEVVFFQRYKGALAGLGITLQRPEEKKPTKIFCRCQIETIGLMKDRDKVGLVSLGFKPIPPDLAQVIEQHFLSLAYLKERYASLSRRLLQVTADNARLLGYNNMSTMVYEGQQLKLALFALAADMADFLLPMNSPQVEIGKPLALNPYFQRYRFSVRGSVEQVTRLSNGVQKVRAHLDFSAELVQLLSDGFEAGLSPLPSPAPGTA